MAFLIRIGIGALMRTRMQHGVFGTSRWPAYPL